jgi:hypothetical protein
MKNGPPLHRNRQGTRNFEVSALGGLSVPGPVSIVLEQSAMPAGLFWVEEGLFVLATSAAGLN